jgi:hypothetical protein
MTNPPRAGRLTWWLIVLCLITIGLNLWARIGPGTWTARLICEEPDHSFGEQADDVLIAHEFRLSNVGWKDLTISDVEGDCGCITVLNKSIVIPPGRTLLLPITLSLDGYRGAIVRKIMIRSDDPTRPAMQLRFLGTVQADGANVATES